MFREVTQIWRMIRPDASGVLEDPRLLRAMPRYVRAVKGVLPARYRIARMVRWDPPREATMQELLKEHACLLSEEADLMERIDGGGAHAPLRAAKSLLDLKALIAARLLERCRLCERECSVDRTKGELGYCRLGNGMGVSSAFVHMGEEPEIVPSFTVYGH